MRRATGQRQPARQRAGRKVGVVSCCVVGQHWRAPCLLTGLRVQRTARVTTGSASLSSGSLPGWEVMRRLGKQCSSSARVVMPEPCSRLHSHVEPSGQGVSFSVGAALGKCPPATQCPQPASLPVGQVQASCAGSHSLLLPGGEADSRAQLSQGCGEEALPQLSILLHSPPPLLQGSHP